MYFLLLLTGIFISEVKCGYYFVTAPNVIRFDHEETVVVGVFGLTNAEVKVWLQHGENKFSEKNVTVKNENEPSFTTVKVKETNIFNSVVEDEKPRKIRIYSEWDGKSQSREIILSYQTGYLIVQTDKPIYTPLQKVKVRTLALDESLKAVDGWQVGMDIVSPSNLTMARKTITKSDSGFFQNQFTLPDYPELGIWTARAFYRGQFETESRSLFEVREYVLPTFGVTVDVDKPYILSDTTDILVTVRAKYVYGKPVDGKARLTLNLKNLTGLSEYILDVNQKSLENNNREEGSVTEFNIRVADIRDSPLLRDRDFPPDGSRLEIVATVYESATGKEEATSHGETIFAIKPYIFKFTRSKLNFRPGMEYYLKVDMLYANGQPVPKQAVKLKMFENGQNDHIRIGDETTDSKGQVLFICAISQGVDTIKFVAATSDESYESELFEVKAYGGKNQIQVEQIIKNDEMVMRAYTNTQGTGYTGMLFMVIARGKIIYTKFKEATNQVSEKIVEELQEKVSPNARLLVFYVDKGSHEMVADSVKFSVDKKCRGEGLKLKTEAKVNPGSSHKLSVTGSPFMWVGFSVMDKALFLLNDNNILKKDKMFDFLKAHDVGCGEGSGRTSADVFKKSGLTILTNAAVDENGLLRNSDGCDGERRKKRDDGGCYYGADIECCNQGYEYAEVLYYESDFPERMYPSVKCYAKARKLVKGRTLPTKCIMAYFETCRESLQDLISDKTYIMSKSLDDESSFASDLELLTDHKVRRVPRSDFRDSWLFETDQLNIKGQMIKTLNFPHSITEWMIQAVGITEDKGMCIADAIDVKAFRNFFIQLDIPYKAVRLEKIDVKATIFNYKNQFSSKDKTANIYLEGEERLCLNNKPGLPSPRVQVNLAPNSAKTVNFPMIPLEHGERSVTVTAVVADAGIPEVDVIEKKLYVVNEGVEENIAINVCLDPKNQRDDCKNDEERVTSIRPTSTGIVYKVNLTLPNDSIPQTGTATAYIQSNIMDNVVKTIIEGVDSLFRKPSGCSEQKMVKLAPTVYAMRYLKETKQMTSELETNGSEWIRHGVNTEISEYRNDDGSYSAYRRHQPSTWLTAFVAKVFCQAKKVVDDAVDEHEDIETTINWLRKYMEEDGSFVDNNPVRDWKMMGQTGHSDQTSVVDPSLTAFVLISLLECDIKPSGKSETVQKATQYLERLSERLLKNNPYLLAISTYALALANSNTAYRFKGYLHDIQNRNGRDMYWGDAGGKPASAQSVETTSYALLAMIEFGDFKNSAFIVRWLTSQRDAGGAFKSTQDTVIGLQALSQYNIATYSPEVDLKVKLLATEWKSYQLSVTRENAIVQRIIDDLPVEHGDNKLEVQVSGSGSARMIIDLRYNRPATKEEKCPFEISSIEVEEINQDTIEGPIAKERSCDICGRCELDPEEPDDYDSYMFGHSTEENLQIESHFGRRKRRAGGKEGAPKDVCIRFTVSSINGSEYGMSIVKFGLETGVEIVEGVLDKLLDSNRNIARYEMPSIGKGFVVFYLNEILSNETKFIFRVNDNFEGAKNSRQPASVEVYDYYNPDKHCTQFYGIGPNRGQSVSYECNEDEKQCQCLQSTCVQPVENEIIRLVKNRRKPALMLFKYTCDLRKANYAVHVKIESLTYNPEKGQKIATAKVLKGIHPGIQKLEAGDEMTFFWSMKCVTPALEKGKEYIIIGKDGNNFATDGGEEYRYELSETALVISKSRRNKFLKNVLKAYMKVSKKGCQT